MRLYNGCPDSQLKAKWDEEAKLDRKVKRLSLKLHNLCAKADSSISPAHCTYFPMEETYSVWFKYKQITDNHSNQIGALQEAIKLLQNSINTSLDIGGV